MIQRAKEIMKMNKDNGKSLIRHGGYEYYEDNPALTMHEAVEKIWSSAGCTNSQTDTYGRLVVAVVMQ